MYIARDRPSAPCRSVQGCWSAFESGGREQNRKAVALLASVTDADASSITESLLAWTCSSIRIGRNIDGCWSLGSGVSEGVSGDLHPSKKGNLSPRVYRAGGRPEAETRFSHVAYERRVANRTSRQCLSSHPVLFRDGRKCGSIERVATFSRNR